jgi:K+-transporting ATPase c subunit
LRRKRREKYTSTTERSQVSNIQKSTSKQCETLNKSAQDPHMSIHCETLNKSGHEPHMSIHCETLNKSGHDPHMSIQAATRNQFQVEEVEVT